MLCISTQGVHQLIPAAAMKNVSAHRLVNQAPTKQLNPLAKHVTLVNINLDEDNPVVHH
jgi:hypothetical protein